MVNVSPPGRFAAKTRSGESLRVLVFHGTVTSLPTARPSGPIPGGERGEAEGRLLRGLGVHAGARFGGGEPNGAALLSHVSR